jgi:hypothetical protein
MNSPTFEIREVSQLYEEIRDWCHPDHPFLDPKYSLESNVPAIDLTPYLATWLEAGRLEGIVELWKFLTYRDEPGVFDLALQQALYSLRKILKARLPPGIQLSKTAQHELHAICILTLRAALRIGHNISRVGARLAATTIACRQMVLDPALANEVIRLVCSEQRDVEDVESNWVEEFRDAARLAIETAMSPLGPAESAAERLKVVPPMARCVVYDFACAGSSRRGIRPELNYEDRMYGCGGASNQQYVEWLGFIGMPGDDASIPSGVSKDVLIEAFEQRGISCDKAMTRKAMLEKAHEIPGFLAHLISRQNPQQRELLGEWKGPVAAWTSRVRCVEPVAAAIIKFMALSAMNERGTAKPFFNDLPSYSIFKTLTQVNCGAGQFACNNCDSGRIDEYPAIELLKVYDRELPEKGWEQRWLAACEMAADTKARQAFKKTGRFVALKSSRVWQALGDGAGGYGDALGNPFPPFACDSGFDTEELSSKEAVNLGLLTPGERAEAALSFKISFRGGFS